MSEKPEDNPYNLPFRFAKASPSVLIVGSGTGNDAAAAVRNRSSLIDAVEIDPAILQLGRSEHPEHPYDSLAVTTHVTDARAFFKRSTRRYDLVLFGLLDSHTQLSDYSNMRIDNFVYTEESFREAKKLLTDDGVLFVKFQVDKQWIAQRLIRMLQEIFGKAPLVFSAPSTYSASASCFVISPSDRTERILTSDSSLAQFVRNNPLQTTKDDVPVTTDDWPYLYQRDRRIPQLFVLVSVLVVFLATILYLQIPGTRDSMPSPFFFFMGSGFMLMETQVLSRLALYFGTTWQVNGIVMSSLLVSILAANMVIALYKGAISYWFILSGLFLGLGSAYFIPLSRLSFHPAIVGLIASGVFAVPVFFAGLLFSKEFAQVASPSLALGANVLGAVFGGLLENLSLVIGMRALLLLAILIYSFAALALLIRRRTRAGSMTLVLDL
jgi:SAM-dependent methyltransferase